MRSSGEFGVCADDGVVVIVMDTNNVMTRIFNTDRFFLNFAFIENLQMFIYRISLFIDSKYPRDKNGGD